ncbi:MAG: UDP-glucose/GDP-mannose dehydrogenase family protein [Burkholderiales bacterium]|jgi:UDPglucose 6-dehydrogenase|nr:UDP-glucose/GDP-mannose dehydrogenase family protein [Burkholderiales bacterium]
MNIVVMGSGYVGLVTGACLAEMGNLVTCIDSDTRRIAQLRLGILPFFEPGLESLVQRNSQQRRLSFGSDARDALAAAGLVFIAVGTPPLAHGAADTRHVMAAAAEIGQHMQPGCVVVNKSTAPVGTVQCIRDILDRAAAQRGLAYSHEVVANPEFLREGTAVHDFMSPDRVVIGVDGERAERTMRALYAPFVRHHERLIVMGVRDAELSKYAANAMLATRISFMNEMARLCDALGADIENVRRGIGSDTRIGYSYLYAGCGYGGSCFPKDVRALIDMARQARVESGILAAVARTNEAQKQWASEVIADRYGHRLQGRRFGIWGLSFKPNTDDLREAPAITIIADLLAAGAKVVAHDPVAMPRAREQLPAAWLVTGALQFAEDPYLALEGVDALVLATEWKPYRAPDFEAMKARMRGRLIVDGRNQYDPQQMLALGFEYRGVGRGAALAQPPQTTAWPARQVTASGSAATV